MAIVEVDFCGGKVHIEDRKGPHQKFVVNPDTLKVPRIEIWVECPKEAVENIAISIGNGFMNILRDVEGA